MSSPFVLINKPIGMFYNVILQISNRSKALSIIDISRI